MWKYIDYTNWKYFDVKCGHVRLSLIYPTYIFIPSNCRTFVVNTESKGTALCSPVVWLHVNIQTQVDDGKGIWHDFCFDFVDFSLTCWIPTKLQMYYSPELRLSVYLSSIRCWCCFIAVVLSRNECKHNLVSEFIELFFFYHPPGLYNRQQRYLKSVN